MCPSRDRAVQVRRPATIPVRLPDPSEAPRSGGSRAIFVPAPPASACVEHGPMASPDHASGPEPEQLAAHERMIVGVVAQLHDDGESAPLTALVHGGQEGLTHAREALEVLGELDPQLLVQVALDALICVHLGGRAAAQPSG
jgi:hypothetical protein